MRGFMRGQMCMWCLRANKVEQKSACAPDARYWAGKPTCLWAGKPARLSQKSKKKIQMNFSPISGELAGKQVG
jgi:hypothetical protein